MEQQVENQEVKDIKELDEQGYLKFMRQFKHKYWCVQLDDQCWNLVNHYAYLVFKKNEQPSFGKELVTISPYSFVGDKLCLCMIDGTIGKWNSRIKNLKEQNLVLQETTSDDGGTFVFWTKDLDTVAEAFKIKKKSTRVLSDEQKQLGKERLEKARQAQKQGS